ncbi:MAG: hypothetical protein AAGI03_14985 [Pseudomonadota bacterium]
MNDQPISVRERPLKSILRAPLGKSRIRRPADGMYAGILPGTRLWLREAYFLHERFDRVSPSQAAKLGAEPTFSIDVADKHDPSLGLGCSRAAYTLPRPWHRYHLVLLEVKAEPLLEITEEDAKADGFGSRAAWLHEWDDLVGTIRTHDRSRSAKSNPTVLVMDVQLMTFPLDANPPQRKAAA